MKEKFFPKLIGIHMLPNGIEAQLKLDENDAEIIVIDSKMLTRYLLKQEQAKKAITQINHMCWSGMSPNQALIKWLSENVEK